MSSIRIISCVCLASLLISCAGPAKQTATTSITIFSINDFHGNLQADKPVPYMAPAPSSEPSGHDQVGSLPTRAAGGYAYLATLLKQRQALVSASILVGAGDLIGASPIGSAMLRDEPVIEALNQLGLSVSSVGNHEFDAGGAAFQAKVKGECPATGCSFPGFSGARYEYIAANVLNKTDAKTWLKPYVIRQVGDVKVAFIGAVTSDMPNLVAADGIKTLRFEDEAMAINRYVPEIQQQGVSAIVALIHEGATYQGAANDPTYLCDGLQGPMIDITKKLDKAISLVISAHTHQGYTCKIDGHLLVQGRSYGAYLTETTLTIDRNSKQVVNAVATNHLVDQTTIKADPVAQQLVEQVTSLTVAVRSRPITVLAAPLTRASKAGHFDSSLGNVIADAQLQFAKSTGDSDISFMNAGGIRNDLPSGNQSSPVAINFGDIYAVQPFGNNLVKMRLSGQQIISLLQQQWQDRPIDDPKKLFVSQGFSYAWKPTAELSQRVQGVRLNGQLLEPTRQYSVIVNSFLADGGDGFTVLKQGTERQIIGRDLDAFEAHIRQQGSALSDVKTDRVRRSD